MERAILWGLVVGLMAIVFSTVCRIGSLEALAVRHERIIESLLDRVSKLED